MGKTVVPLEILTISEQLNCRIRPSTFGSSISTSSSKSADSAAESFAFFVDFFPVTLDFGLGRAPGGGRTRAATLRAVRLA